MSLSVIVLAAGQGTRMNSDLPKVLHRVGGAPMLVHAMQAAAPLSPERTVVVAGAGFAEVSKAALAQDETAVLVEQAEQLGTGHAVAMAAPALAEFRGDVIVLYGDTPLIRSETLEAMVAARARHAIVVLGFQARDPGRYGRFITEGAALRRIVEFKEATEAERAITLCNSGVICADAEVLFRLVTRLGNQNAAGEYYLTDIVELAWGEGQSVGYITCPEAETMGVNTRTHLAEAEAAFQARARADALDNGVTLTAPDTVWFAHDTHIGRDAIVGPHVVFGPGVTVESGAEILAFCHLEGCHISRGARVGPFARLRPGAELAEDVHVGNFVEIKNSILDQGVKVGHLTYLGDTRVGEFSNIGAGTVTCNYDGVSKHHTEIGNHVFIGSATMLIAPVTVGNGAMTASGSVITRDVPPGALAIARARQDTKPDLATRLFERLRALKAAAKE